MYTERYRGLPAAKVLSRIYSGKDQALWREFDCVQKALSGEFVLADFRTAAMHLIVKDLRKSRNVQAEVNKIDKLASEIAVESPAAAALAIYRAVFDTWFDIREQSRELLATYAMPRVISLFPKLEPFEVGVFTAMMIRTVHQFPDTDIVVHAIHAFRAYHAIRPEEARDLARQVWKLRDSKLAPLLFAAEFQELLRPAQIRAVKNGDWPKRGPV